MNDIKARLQKLTDAALERIKSSRRYSLPIFLVLVGVLYIALLLRAQSLTNSQPATDQINSQLKAAQTPHIDQKVVQQLKTLQDNSVNVQALFNQARNNPFQQ